MDIQDLNKLITSGVYALINHSTKQVYLSYSSCMASSLVSLLGKLKQNLHDNSTLIDLYRNNSLTLEVIETDLNDLNLKIRTSFWIRFYRKLGYEVLNNKLPINLSLRVFIEGGLIYVVVKSRNLGKEIEVGTFGSNDECQKFLNRYYPDGVVDELVYKG
jgi:hypothetical protein